MKTLIVTKFIKHTKLVLTLVLMTFGVTKSIAQYTLKGIIMDRDNRFVEFASVAIFCDSLLEYSTFSDSTGNFTLYASKIAECYLIVSAFGFNTKLIYLDDNHLNVLKIQLEDLNSELDEMVFEIDLPVIEKQIGKLIFNPSVLPSTKTSSALELLKSAPTVFISEDGMISIKGVSGARVAIDGRVLNLTENQIKTYLESIAASDILIIEIISTPGAKYDAEGVSGIVNIKLKKNEFNGYIGNVSAGYEQSTYPKLNSNFSIDYKKNSVNLFASTSVKDGTYLKKEYVNNIYSRTLENQNFFEIGQYTKEELNLLNTAGFDYQLNGENSISIRGEYGLLNKSGLNANYNEFQDSNLFVDSMYNSIIRLNENYSTITSNFSYEYINDSAGKELTFGVDYLYYFQPALKTETWTSTNTNNIWNPNQIVFNNTAFQDIILISSRIDFYHNKTDNFAYDFGAKVTSLKTDNILTFNDRLNDSWVKNSEKSNTFFYEEQNIAGYVTTSFVIGNRIDVQTGLRTENTIFEGKDENGTSLAKNNYTGIFPSLFIQKNIHKDDVISFSYNRRITRPGFNDISPYKYYISPNSYIVGDPFLKPAFTHGMDLSYLLKSKFFISGIVNLTENHITQVFSLNSETQTYNTLSINLNNSYYYGLNLFFNQGINKRWKTSCNIGAGLNGAKATQAGLIINQSSALLMLQNTNVFILGRNERTQLQTLLYYQPSGAVQGIMVLGRILDYSMHLSHTSRNKTFTYTISLLDIFNSAYITATIDNKDHYSFISGNYDRRGIKVSLNYAFGKESVEKHKDRENNISDVEDRIK